MGATPNLSKPNAGNHRTYIHTLEFSMKLLAAAITTLLITMTGCTSLDNGEGRIFQSWKGSHIDQVFRHWGLPQRQAKLSDGSTMYEWGRLQSYTLSGSATSTANIIRNTTYVSTQATAPTTVSGECTRSLIANSDGIVVEGSARGNDCCVMAIAGYCAGLVNPSTK